MKAALSLKTVFVVAACATFLPTASAQDRIIALLTDAGGTYPVASKFHLKVIDRTIGAPFAYYETAIGADRLLVMAEMRQDSRVTWVEDDAEVESPENQSGGKGSTVAVVNDRGTLYGFNAGLLDKISFNSNRAMTPGRSVKIAILDTGLARRSYALWHRVAASANFVESGASAYDQPKGTDSNGNSVPDEGVGHGTFVTGIIDQVAPQCPLVVVRVADSDGVSNAWRLVKGIAFAVTQGCEVANISLGSPVGIAALSDVTEWASARGLLIVAAAGNTNVSHVLYPARIGRVICVTGVDSLDHKASFANYESGVETSAPATGIKGPWIDGTTVIWQGTSFASPWVAGAISDCLRRRPKAYPDDLQRVSGKAGDGINAINPAYNGSLGVRLNIDKLDLSIHQLKNRP